MESEELMRGELQRRGQEIGRRSVGGKRKEKSGRDQGRHRGITYWTGSEDGSSKRMGQGAGKRGILLNIVKGKKDQVNRKLRRQMN